MKSILRASAYHIRAAREKAFNYLLKEYRYFVLPDVKENWDNLAEAEQENCSKPVLLE